MQDTLENREIIGLLLYEDCRVVIKNSFIIRDRSTFRNTQEDLKICSLFFYKPLFI